MASYISGDRIDAEDLPDSHAAWNIAQPQLHGSTMMDSLHTFLSRSDDVDIHLLTAHVDPMAAGNIGSHGNNGSQGHSMLGNIQPTRELELDSPTHGQKGSQFYGMRPANHLLHWATDKDRPWNPAFLLEDPPEVSSSSHFSKHEAVSLEESHFSEAADSVSLHNGLTSDSGYGTRRSIANASVFSYELDQDCTSTDGNMRDLPLFHAGMESLNGRDDDLLSALTTTSKTTDLKCPTCHKHCLTKSELKKHDLRHRKPYKCTVHRCSRVPGFSTTNDLERHVRSVHPEVSIDNGHDKVYRCFVPGCKSKDKLWPRLDNFRSHLKRVHINTLPTDEHRDAMIERAEEWNRTQAATSKDTTRKAADSSLLQNLDHDRVTEIPEGSRFHYMPGMIDPSYARFHENFNPPGMAPTLPRLTVEPSAMFPQLAREEEILPPRAVPTLVDLIRDLEDQNSQPWQDVIMDTDKQKVDIPAPSRSKAPKAIKGGNSQTGSTVNNSQTTSDADAAKTSNLSASSAYSSGSRSSDVDSDSDLEALKAIAKLQRLGYVVSKDPKHIGKPKFNRGTAAGRKSSKQVICKTCNIFRGRPSEVRKHKLRHTRPYGCTFPSCRKPFGSKNDWKRHENSQHFHHESWKCDLPVLPIGYKGTPPDASICGKVAYRRQTFLKHLIRDHGIKDDQAKEEKYERCRLGRGCQSRFWCGFCVKVVELKSKGLGAWGERFDHIDNHFMGRVEGGLKKGMGEWVHFMGSAFGEDEPAILRGEKRGSLEGVEEIDEERLKKMSRRRTWEERVYCCQCPDYTADHNAQLDLHCSVCDHAFCGSCVRKVKQDDVDVDVTMEQNG